MKFSKIIDHSLEIGWSKMKVRITIEVPRVLTNTVFLEHVEDSSGQPTETLIARQEENILFSKDFGRNWEKCDIGFVPEKCFTPSSGNHILYCSEKESISVFSHDWNLIGESYGFPHPWHGSWSISESSDGTIMWGEYAYADDNLAVFRSSNDGLDWEKVLTISGGGEDPHGGKIRHFHTCLSYPDTPGRWLLSSGDTDSQCRMWETSDNGSNWSEISFEEDKIISSKSTRIVTPKLWRRTAERYSGDYIIYPTDDNHQKTGSRLVRMDRGNPQVAEIIGHLGPNEIRNFVEIDKGYFISISESKNDKSAIFVYLCHPKLGSTPLLEIPNEMNLKSNGCNSISSKSAIDGVFWSFQDGIAIRKKPKIMKWSVNLDYSDEVESNVEYNKPIQKNQELYPTPTMPKEALEKELPFIDPTNPSRRGLPIEKILERATFDGIYGLPIYNPEKGYLTLHKSDILNNKVVEFDKKLGIPVNQYSHLDKPHPYPVSIGLYALEQYSKFHEFSNEENLTNFRTTCMWILENQTQEGTWPCQFEYTFFKERGGKMKKGWVSALAQGYCISSLCRLLSHIRSNERDEELESLIASKIEGALHPFQIEVESGGIKRKFLQVFSFYEEYPTPKPSFVLNGFIFSLLGLYDAWKTIESDLAKILYNDGIRTLQASLPFFDLGDRSSYDLTHLQEGNESMPPNPARKGYHDTHIRLLDAIDVIEGGKFTDVLVRWILYRYGIPSSNN